MAGIRRSISHIVAVAMTGMVWTGCAWAAPTWIQIEAKPNLPAATDRARDWSDSFADLGGFRMRGGWYALALGPYEDRAAAQAQLESLRDSGLIPGDSYLTDQQDYRDRFWPEITPETAPLDVTVTVDPARMDAVQDAPPDPATDAAPEAAPEATVETLTQSRAQEARLTRAERMETQAALQWLGFYTGNIDGAFGPGTRVSVGDWQTAQGATATGVLTTSQRADLLARVEADRAALGLERVEDAQAGISLDLPMTQLKFSHYDPPFALYQGADVTVLLISRQGDRGALSGLFDTLSSLSLMPVSGERSLDRAGFVLNGADAQRHAYAQASLSGGLIKGFLISYPAGAEAQMARTLVAMKASFRPLGNATLDPALGPALAVARDDLMRGTAPVAAHPAQSGFYINSGGAVLTASAGLERCAAPLIEDLPARVTFRDPDLGLAVLTPDQPHVPPMVATWRPHLPAAGDHIALAGFSYPEAMAAPVVTLGTLAAATGLNGQPQNARLSVRMLPGDAGGPVLDRTGAVLGMALPQTEGRILPEGLGEAVQAGPLTQVLHDRGLNPDQSAPNTQLTPAELARHAAAITVRVGCAG